MRSDHAKNTICISKLNAAGDTGAPMFDNHSDGTAAQPGEISGYSDTP